MRSPKKVKYRKCMKRLRALTGVETRGVSLENGGFGIKALEAGWITARQIEAARIAINRKVKRGGKIYIPVFPNRPITRKPAETRMGSGKGSPEGFVADVRAGRILFELEGVEEALSRVALQRAIAKLPLRCTIVKRSEFLL